MHNEQDGQRNHEDMYWLCLGFAEVTAVRNAGISAQKHGGDSESISRLLTNFKLDGWGSRKWH